MARTCLTGALTLNISPSGSDTTGDGSAGNPFLTPAGAWNYVRINIDLCSNPLTFQFANGTYSYAGGVGGSCSGPLVGQNGLTSVKFVGDANDPTQVVIEPTNNQPCFSAQEGAAFCVEGVSMDMSQIVGGFAPGSQAACSMTHGSSMGIGNVIFGPNPGGIDLQPGIGSRLYCYQSAVPGGFAPGYTINRGGPNAQAYAHIQGDPAQYTYYGPSAYPDFYITCTGNPSFDTNFGFFNGGSACLQNIIINGEITAPSPTWYMIPGSGGVLAD